MSNKKKVSLLNENCIFEELLGSEIIVVTDADQLNLLGQTFRPIFTGTVSHVTNGFLTLDPVIVKMHNAPYYRFPTPLSIPIEKISWFSPFDPNRRLPLI